MNGLKVHRDGAGLARSERRSANKRLRAGPGKALQKRPVGIGDRGAGRKVARNRGLRCIEVKREAGACDEGADIDRAEVVTVDLQLLDFGRAAAVERVVVVAVDVYA